MNKNYSLISLKELQLQEIENKQQQAPQPPAGNQENLDILMNVA